MLTNLNLRTARQSDLPVLQDALFEAAYWRPEQPRPDLEQGLARPDLVYLLADWGRPGDNGVVALDGSGQALGAAWYRFWTVEQHSYGFINPGIPELAIGVLPAYRRRGVGRNLLTALLDLAIHNAVVQLSLSVESDNPARGLYQKFGFKIYAQAQNAWTMLVNLDRQE